MSNEALLLFIVALVIALSVASGLYAHVMGAKERAEVAASQVVQRAATVLQIVDVRTTTGETNIYLMGLSGELNLYKAVVFLDGVPYDPTVLAIRDGEKPGILEPGDLYLLRVPASFSACLKIYVDGLLEVYGQC